MQNPSRTLPVLAALAGAATLLGACAGDTSKNEPIAEGAAVEPPVPAESTPEGTPATAARPAAGGQAPAAEAVTGLFHAPEPWTKVVAGMPKSEASDRIVGWLADHGGWGTHTMRIDFGLHVLHAVGGTPFRTFTPTEEFYTPDCDQVPFPIPEAGAVEEEESYACTDDGDCHLLVVHESSHKLYEMWRADLGGSGFKGGCATVWDLDRSYPKGRGDNCTSADAGGFPISAMVFTADEVAKGSIDHAIRFVLPNSRIRRGVFVAPASHASDALHGGPDAPPYGVRFRLRADYPLETLPTEGARVVARAMQRYGMLLADGGRTPLTATSDRFTEHKWAEVGMDENAMSAIAVGDMEVVDLGEPIKATGDCVRE
jgi:serine/threonine-protein kinase